MPSPVGSGHIVAMGGGGFLMEPENPLLDDFVLSLARRQPARVCFLPTASADSANAIVRFYRAFSPRAIATDLTLFDSPLLPRRPARSADLAAVVADQDVIYVGGGNTANMLALWRTHGLDRILRDAWVNGTVLAGVSAGMLCWFSGGVTDSFGGFETLDDGLCLVDALACPHWDGEPARQDVFRRRVAAGEVAGYAADDGAALHFAGPELVRAVSSRALASAYVLKPVSGGVHERPLPTTYLGSAVNDEASKPV
jgi:peptidase E